VPRRTSYCDFVSNPLDIGDWQYRASTAQPEQNLNSLGWPRAGDQPLKAGERATRDAHAITGPEAAQLGELNETVALTLAELGDHAVGDLGRHPAVGDQADHARRPFDFMPLQNDEHEGVTGEQRSRILTAGGAWRPDPWRIDVEAGDMLKAMQRQPLVVRHQLRAGPERHGRTSGVFANAVSMSRPGIELGRLVEPSLRFADTAEDLAIADRLAAQAVGNRLQECVAITNV
jgi:hypothetical protein